MTKAKVLYSACYGDDGFPFTGLANEVKAVVKPSEMTEFDSILVVWGGADISPQLYNHPMSRRCAPYAGRRDFVEWELIQEAIDMEIPIIGICRGAQMLCAAAGGFLLQDVNNHERGHNVTTHDGKQFQVNSIHHQMMVPIGADGKPVEHELVGWASENVGAPYIYRDDKIFVADKYGYTVETWKEPEFLYFPKIDGYAIQWHPEGMSQKSEATQYILNFFEEKQKKMRPQKFWVTGETNAA